MIRALLMFTFILPVMLLQAQDDERLRNNLVIVFDGSGSMRGDKIHIAKSSLGAFMKALPADWNVGLIVFDSKGVHEALPLGPVDTHKVEDAVAPISAGGKTPLGKSIYLARNMLADAREEQLGYGRFQALVITDGEASDGPYMNQACTEFLKAGYYLSVIGFQLGGGHSLRNFATDYREAGNQEELSRAMQEAVAEIDTSQSGFDFEPLTISDADLLPPEG